MASVLYKLAFVPYKFTSKLGSITMTSLMHRLGSGRSGKNVLASWACSMGVPITCWLACWPGVPGALASWSGVRGVQGCLLRGFMKNLAPGSLQELFEL
jgi:hypothetical protein